MRTTRPSLIVNILYISKTTPNNGYSTEACIFAGPRPWNTFDDEFRGCIHVEIFKEILKTLLSFMLLSTHSHDPC